MTNITNYKKLSAHINQIGIGDLTFFAAWILNKEYDSVDLCISEDSLNRYKSDAAGYKKFAFDYLRFILPSVEINESNNKNSIFSISNLDIKFGSFDSLINEKSKKHFLSVFNSSKETSQDQVCIVTKARNFSHDKGLAALNLIIEILNSNNKKVFLMGERHVEFNKEYQSYGHQKIYSVYDYVKNGIRSELLHDLSVEKLGLTTPDIATLKSDLSIMSSSRKTIVIGCGGMFCTSILCGNLLSICDNIDAQNVKGQIGTQVHCNLQSFKDSLVNSLLL